MFGDSEKFVNLIGIYIDYNSIYCSAQLPSDKQVWAAMEAFWSLFAMMELSGGKSQIIQLFSHLDVLVIFR